VVSTMFWMLAGLMSVLALAFVLPPLWRRRDTDTVSGEDLHRLKALEQAHAAGVLDEAEYQAKRAAYGTVEPARASGARPWIAAAVLALTIPLGAWLMYGKLGDPRGLDPASVTAPAAADPHQAGDTAAPSMDQAVAGLAERMRADPDNLEGWMLLGRAYKTMERFEPAREALANAYRLAPNDSDVMVEYAETLALASPNRLFGAEASALVEQAVAANPEHQRGIWLQGIAAMQSGNAEYAIERWQHLQSLVADDAEAVDSLQTQIDAARGQLGLPPGERPAGAAAPAAQATAPAVDPHAPIAADPHASMAMAPAPAAAPAVNGSASADGGAKLTVRVDVAPALKAKVGASDVLLVYARAPEGSRVPFAIQRLPAGSLPTTVVLDDSTAMMPELRLSTQNQVVVGARISRSGQAIPQSGDLETQSAPVAVSRAEPLSLIIDREIE
jgi:cytochrome c-type biogenesis protein CcmH